MDDRYHNVRGPIHAVDDREEARTHANDIVAVVSAHAQRNEFRKAFGAQFGDDSSLKARVYGIIRDYFADGSKPGLILYREFLAANLAPDESVRELDTELRRAQRLISSLLLE